MRSKILVTTFKVFIPFAFGGALGLLGSFLWILAIEQTHPIDSTLKEVAMIICSFSGAYGASSLYIKSSE